MEVVAAVSVQLALMETILPKSRPKGRKTDTIAKFPNQKIYKGYLTMKNSRSEAYAAAGVDITAGYKAVELMKKHIAKTMTSGVCSDVGGFGGLFELDLPGITRPVLVSGTDGVGTKLKIAFWTSMILLVLTALLCVLMILFAAVRNLYFSLII